MSQQTISPANANKDLKVQNNPQYKSSISLENVAKINFSYVRDLGNNEKGSGDAVVDIKSDSSVKFNTQSVLSGSLNSAGKFAANVENGVMKLTGLVTYKDGKTETVDFLKAREQKVIDVKLPPVVPTAPTKVLLAKQEEPVYALKLDSSEPRKQTVIAEKAVPPAPALPEDIKSEKKVETKKVTDVPKVDLKALTPDQIIKYKTASGSGNINIDEIHKDTSSADFPGVGSLKRNPDGRTFSFTPKSDAIIDIVSREGSTRVATPQTPKAAPPVASAEAAKPGGVTYADDKGKKYFTDPKIAPYHKTESAAIEYLNNHPDEKIAVAVTAHWCGPCKNINTPNLIDLVKAKEITLILVDNDTLSEAGTFNGQFSASLPTTYVYSGNHAGKTTEVKVGAVEKAEYKRVFGITE